MKFRTTIDQIVGWHSMMPVMQLHEVVTDPSDYPGWSEDMVAEWHAAAVALAELPPEARYAAEDLIDARSRQARDDEEILYIMKTVIEEAMVENREGS